MRISSSQYRTASPELTLLLILAAACASAPPEPTPTAQQLEEVAADEKCGRETGRPCFTPYTQAPKLVNEQNVVRAITRHYPPKLREQRISGTAVMWLFLDEKGNVQTIRLRRTSGYPELDRAAQQVARVMRFEAARNRSVPVKVWVEIPVMFQAR